MKCKTWPLALLLSLTMACGDDDSSADTDAGTEQDAGSGYICDPVGSNPDQSALFNAPLDEGVEIIEKVPQHPGDPGPTGLP